jgi:hypothetical protein
MINGSVSLVVACCSRRPYARADVQITDMRSYLKSLLSKLHEKPCLNFLSCVKITYSKSGRSHWPRSLRRKFAASRLLTVWVRIPLGAWIRVFVSVVCCQVEISATSSFLIQKSPTDCGASLCVF